MHVLLIKLLMIFNIFGVPQNNFDIIGVTETRITKLVSLLNNLNLINSYSYKFTPTETAAGGTLLYVGNYIPYKYFNDLNI